MTVGICPISTASPNALVKVAGGVQVAVLGAATVPALLTATSVMVSTVLFAVHAQVDLFRLDPPVFFVSGQLSRGADVPGWDHRGNGSTPLGLRPDRFMSV